jgi:amino acid transporter
VSQPGTGPDQESKPVSFPSAVSLGVGTMIGAGIFALLGEAGTIAGSAVWISFLIGGVIALLSGYSLGKLGARFPSAGGLVEYLIHGFGDTVFAGAMSVMMYLAALVSVSLVAKTFGTYAAGLLPGDPPSVTASGLAVAVMAVLVVVNLNGSASVARSELVIVVVKFAVLVAIGIGGLIAINPSLLAPSDYPGPGSILASVAVTFFAYEGFRVVTNAAEDVPDPERTIPRAIMTAIILVMGLYLLIAVAVFGTLTTGEVVAASENALAEAARPVFGSVGFVLVSITALIATASAINASLYAVTNVTYQMAKDGELPGVFGHPIAHSREGLLVSAAVITVLAVGFDLSQIAVLGATSILIVHSVVHIGHLRLLDQTGAQPLPIVLAAMLGLGAVAVTIYDTYTSSPSTVVILVVFIVAAVGIEGGLRALSPRRTLNTRTA